jgi:photosystem II stability/assembly factor-like uncharacterized protein
MLKFKFLVFSFFLILSALTSFSQNLQKPSPSEIERAPHWAQLMYSENPSIFEVDRAYREFYSNSAFEKSFHTQYYKRWRRKYLNYIDENGFIHEPSQEELEKSEKVYRNKQTNEKSSNWSIVGPITNHQEGGSQGSGQTNVYSVDQCLNTPSVLYCGTEPGEVYKSSDEGLNWTLVSKNEDFGSGVTAIEVHHTNPNLVFAGGNNGVFRSSDGAQTWTNVLPNTNLGVNELLIHPTNDQLVFACTDKGLFRSLDSGLTWSILFSNKTYDIKVNTADGSILYIVRNNPSAIICEFLKSTDFGATWNVQNNGWYSSSDAARNDGGARLAVSPANPNRIYAYLIGESKPNDFGYIGVYRSDDGGVSWSLPNGPVGGPYTTSHANLAIGWPEWTYHQGFYNCALMASTTNPDEILVGGLNLYKSTDGGSSFSPVAGYVGGPLGMHVDMQDFRIIGNTAWVTTDGGVYRSSDFFDSNYEFRMSGVHGSDYWGFGSGWNEDVLVGGLYHNGNLAYHENYGTGNFLELGGGEAPTGYVNPGENRRTYFSDIAGKIIPINLNDPIANAAFGMAPNESYWAAESSEMEFHPNCYSVAYIGKANAIWKTTDGGASFNLLFTFGTNTANQVKYIEVSSSNPNVIYLNQQPASGSNGILWKTTDGGVTWTQLNKPSGNSRRMLLSINPQNEHELWIAYPDGANGFKVFKTSNSGQNWENWTSSIFNSESVQALKYIAGTDGGVYIATNRAVYYRNNTTLFQLENSGLPLFTNGNIFQPFYRDGKIRLATYGKGIWESSLSEQPSQCIARAMVDKLAQEVVCEIDSFFFEDHSFLNHTNATWNWTFPTGTPSASNLRNPAVLFSQAGNHLAILQITDGNGNTDSDTIQVTVNYFSLPTSVSEGFEGVFVPSGWSISNPNNDVQWSLSSTAGGYGNSSKSAIFDNYNNDSQGNSDDLIMHFNASTITTNSFLKFDVAYARWGSGYSDTLEVLASTDCGITYQSLYLKGGTDLATSPDFQEYFTPNTSQWRTDSVDLIAYANELNLQIAFRNIGRYGNVVYLDNINIGNFATITEIEKTKPSIYPNPVKAGESIAIKFTGEYTGYLLDQKGSKVQIQKAKDDSMFYIPENISSGLYILQIQTATKIWNEHVSVIK